MDAPYIVSYHLVENRKYNPKYGDDRICKCGHQYYRHFDTYEDMYPIGCKYCDCCTFEELIVPERVKASKTYLDNFIRVYNEAADLTHLVGDVMDWLNDETKNTSRDAPYHNLFHTLCMIVNCNDGYFHHIDVNTDYDYDTHATLMIAAAFHDFAHSAGAQDDDWNIANAIKWVELFFEDQSQKYVHNTYFQDKNNLATIKKLITVTRFPFIHEPQTRLEKIIRDSDLLQCYEDAWFEHVIQGLQQEFAVKGRVIETTEFLRLQVEFLKNAKFYTNRWFEKRGSFTSICERVETKLFEITK